MTTENTLTMPIKKERFGRLDLMPKRIIWVVFGVDGNINIPRAWFSTEAKAQRYIRSWGDSYFEYHRVVEGEFY